MRQILIWLLLGTGGGTTRIQIIQELKIRPQNLNKLAESIGVSYTTAKYHIKILEHEKLVTSKGGYYGKVYFLSSLLEENYFLFNEILKERK